MRMNLGDEPGDLQQDRLRDLTSKESRHVRRAVLVPAHVSWRRSHMRGEMEKTLLPKRSSGIPASTSANSSTVVKRNTILALPADWIPGKHREWDRGYQRGVSSWNSAPRTLIHETGAVRSQSGRHMTSGTIQKPTFFPWFCSSSHFFRGAKYSSMADASNFFSPVTVSSASGQGRLRPMASISFSFSPAFVLP